MRGGLSLGLGRGVEEEEKELRVVVVVVPGGRSVCDCRGMLIKDVHSLLAAVAGRRSSMVVMSNRRRLVGRGI